MYRVIMVHAIREFPAVTWNAFGFEMSRMANGTEMVEFSNYLRKTDGYAFVSVIFLSVCLPVC